MKKLGHLLCGVSLFALLMGCEPGLDKDTSRTSSQSPRQGAADSLLIEGRQAYTTYCAGCHGTNGDGNGPAAGFLHPRPRNFQNASFKFSSTRAGSLPTDEDLKRSIRQGLRGTAMPDWPLLSEQTVDALVVYVKTFSPKWQERRPAARIPTVDDPYRGLADKSQAVQRGEMIYHGYANCWSCHPSYVSESTLNNHLEALESPRRQGFRPGLFESEGKVSGEGELIYPPDFRRDFVRGGMSVDDLYRSIAAGITGTAMPTWVDTMDIKAAHGGALVQPADLWAMAYYVQHLMQQRPARLAGGSFAVRTRPQTLYFHGEVPPPAQEPSTGKTDEVFEE